jgi:hypothetical protein
MNEVAALHAAARRYLIDRHAKWTARYAEIGHPTSGRYSEQALDTFPRSNVLAAILEDVEWFRPEDWTTVQAARDDLVTVAGSAENMFTCDPISDVDARAMAEERKLFVRYLNSLEEPQLHDIEPLPYRRVLGEAEAATLRSQLAAAWGIAGGYWYPLDGVERQDVLAFQAPYFRRDLPGSTLHRLIGESGVSRVYELREYGPNYELDLGEMDPEYNGAEGYWCAESLDLDHIRLARILSHRRRARVSCRYSASLARLGPVRVDLAVLLRESTSKPNKEMKLARACRVIDLSSMGRAAYLQSRSQESFRHARKH